MKKSILSIALLTASGARYAGHKLIVGPPEFIASIGSSSNNKAVTISVQARDCYKATYVCYNPFFMHTNNNGDAVGMDFKFKAPRTMNNGYYISVGPAIFGEPLNHKDGARINYHVGAGMELNRFIFSADIYGNPFDTKEGEPLRMLNIGYRF